MRIWPQSSSGVSVGHALCCFRYSRPKCFSVQNCAFVANYSAPSQTFVRGRRQEHNPVKAGIVRIWRSRVSFLVAFCVAAPVGARAFGGFAASAGFEAIGGRVGI